MVQPITDAPRDKTRVVVSVGSSMGGKETLAAKARVCLTAGGDEGTSALGFALRVSGGHP